MEIIHSIEDMLEKINQLKKSNKQIGFVPTMGFFHDGHTNLMEKAKKDNDIVVTSIFVNPLQFGPNEDYEQYPRDEEKDKLRAEEVGVDILFIPDAKDMYPNKRIIELSIKGRIDVLCGKSRPGHFEGVITVLTKLFHIVQPNKVYFGMKDAQQLAVVSALLNELNFPIELVGVPTIRERDGLAKSSRNVHLNNEEREEAAWLYKALLQGQQLVVDGELNPDIIVKEVSDTIINQTNGVIDYVEIFSYPKLQPITVIDQPVILALAVHFQHARLIDNLIFDKRGQLINHL
ncbi:pantoate--beta-alanine ligase [Virgibacillus alimentarius]|uniref:Pantothenate synthetase n=1 Tax=Virgibacillus alimentarius TaxID=698769 RepID=A0ABS4S7G6_9BACI|nr:pantoate--beta-alanine ligase [Virgibacillus alimentarius]MBP2256357.1 pantoate--beta-alanine ligase [Virgibacillus alimentarius]